jgi:hypothetical protein
VVSFTVKRKEKNKIKNKIKSNLNLRGSDLFNPSLQKALDVR